MNKLAPVLMLEDDALMQTRLKCLLLELGYESDEIRICGTVAEALQADNTRNIALALVDLGLPDGSGITVIEALSLAQPDLPIMVISAWSDENRLFQALEAGANGYLLKERDDLELLLSLRSIIRGGSPIDPNIAQFLLSRLSPPQPSSHTPVVDPVVAPMAEANEHPETIELTSREQYILNLVSLGLSNQEIADDIEVSRYTVETHIRRLYRKLAVSGRTKALHKAKSMGLI